MFSIGSKQWPGLSKLVEECGEVTQVVGKIMGARGDASRPHWDGSDLRKRLQDELADVLAAASFVIQFCDLDEVAIDTRVKVKRALFEHWHKTNPEL